nr:unnamed protein product [Digitaria exilis]
MVSSLGDHALFLGPTSCAFGVLHSAFRCAGAGAAAAAPAASQVITFSMKAGRTLTSGAPPSTPLTYSNGHCPAGPATSRVPAAAFLLPPPAAGADAAADRAASVAAVRTLREGSLDAGRTKSSSAGGTTGIGRPTKKASAWQTVWSVAGAGSSAATSPAVMTPVISLARPPQYTTLAAAADAAGRR